MKIPVLVSALFSASLLAGQITLPCDFESTPTTSDFTDFDGGQASVVPNPSPDAVNSSSSVARIVRGPGALWSGSYLTLQSPAEFGAEAGLRMKVWSPESEIFMRIKFESTQGSVELDEWLTSAGAWTVLEWDFSNLPSGAFDRLVFMFDVGTEGDGSDASTFFFDDIEWFDPDGDLAQPQLPMTWDAPGVYHHAYGFAGSAAWVAPDPQDAGNPVLEVLKTEFALDYSGVVMTNRNGLASAIPFSAEHQVLRARIWSPDVGLPILLKVEDKDDPSVFAQTQATTTTVGWDTLEFDFAAGNPALNLAASYDLPVVFFNFGWTGALFGPMTFRMDDLELVGATPSSVISPQWEVPALLNACLTSGQSLQWTDASLHGSMLHLFDVSGRKAGVVRVAGDRANLPALPVGHYFLVGSALNGAPVRFRLVVGG